MFLPMDEWIEVVNHQNQVVGKALRDRVHEKGLQHRSAHVFLFNLKGELFLQKRSKKKKEHPGYYDSSSAGHLDVAETYLACATRELMEELGIQVDVLVKMGIRKTTDGRSIEHAMLYLSKSDQIPKPNTREVESGQYFSRDQIDTWILEGGENLTPAFLTLFQGFRSQLERFCQNEDQKSY